MKRARARFEIVHTPGRVQPWHVRFVAANGAIVWWTENYTDKRDAKHALDLLAEGFDRRVVRTVEDDDS